MFQNTKLKTKFALLTLATSAAAFAQDPAPTADADHVGTLTEGLTGSFNSVMAVIIPIILVVTAVGIFRKFRNKV